MIGIVFIWTVLMNLVPPLLAALVSVVIFNVTDGAWTVMIVTEHTNEAAVDFLALARTVLAPGLTPDVASWCITYRVREIAAVFGWFHSSIVIFQW